MRYRLRSMVVFPQFREVSVKSRGSDKHFQKTCVVLPLKILPLTSDGCLSTSENRTIHYHLADE
jgi:hypothetical protein